MSLATQTPALVVPAEVLALAAKQGVTTYLPAVLEMTQRIFPNASLSVLVEDDPEIANDRHIVVRVQVEDLDVPQALDARYQWHRELFACCPAPLVSVFRVGLELTE